MNKKQFSALVCPSCVASFEIVKVAQENKYGVEYGVISCHCSEYPIIAGIPILKKSKYLKYTLRYIRENKPNEALLSVIEFGSSLWKRFLVRLFRTELPLNKAKNVFLMKIMNGVQPRYVRENVSLDDATRVWGVWGEYVRKRFWSASFFAGSLMINSMKNKLEKRGKILDVCCGVGQFIYKFEHTLPKTEIFCCDKNFVNLYFLRKFFSKKAAVICCDANKKLPFQNNFFSTVFNSDSFHYVDNKKGCCHEVFRVLKKKGTLIFTHLHNKSAKNAGQGDAKTWQEYGELFEKFCAKTFSEKLFLKKYLLCGKTACLREHNSDELNKSNAFIIVGQK